MELVQWRQGQESLITLGSEFGSITPEISWHRLPKDEDYDLAEFGVDEGENEGHLAFAIPLRVSPCVTGRFICDLGSEAADVRKRGTAGDRRRIFDKVRRIAGVIHRSWGRSMGPRVAETITFDWDDRGTGGDLVYWEPRVNWSPSFLEDAEAVRRAIALTN